MILTSIRQACEVPDPYYRGEDGFANVVKLVKEGGSALLDYLRQQHFSS